jgi:O-antigen ligase
MRRQTATEIISPLLAFLIPVLLGIYWPLYLLEPIQITMALRVGIVLLAGLLLILWRSAPLTYAELRFGGLLTGFCILLLIPTLTATDISRAFTDWTKLLIICAFGISLARCLRDQRTATAFGLGLLVASLVSTVYVLKVYVEFLGFVLPSYEATRIMKGAALDAGGVALNPIASNAVFAYIMSVALGPRSRLMLALSVPIFAFSSFLSGSRAPIGIALLCAGALLVINAQQSKILSVRVAVWIGLSVVAGFAVISAFYLSAREIAAFTEGRSDLWAAAWSNFTERPLTGYGFESWRDDLAARLPGNYQSSIRLAGGLAGGYHNEYFTLLAEQGLPGFLFGMVIIYNLFTSSRRLALFASRSRNSQFLLFACLFLIVRAVVEVPGLFGYAQEPSDYFAYCFLAIVISRLSVFEDISRGTAVDTADQVDLGAFAQSAACE